jgi:molybdenum cofactor guanylyltransferase
LTPAQSRLGQDWAGFVLAGGKSRRMGSDKALVEVAGEPLVVHAIRILEGAGLPVSIAGGQSALSTYARLIQDDGGGPLGGICSALRMTTAAYAIFLSVDMPLIPTSLITHLILHASLTAAALATISASGFTQTFPVAVDRALLPALEAERASGNSRCLAGLLSAATRLGRSSRTIAAESLAQSGQVEHPLGLPVALWFFNVNTAALLNRLRRYVPRAS